MDDSVFEEVMGQTFGEPATGQSGQASATAVMDAETAGWVTEDPVAPSPDGEDGVAPDDGSEYTENGTPTEADFAEAQQLLQALFQSDVNPYRKQAEEAQARINQSMQVVQTIQQQQQRAAMDAALQQRIRQLPDLDPETQAREVQRLVAEREAMTRVQYQAQLSQREQQAEAIARNQVISMLGQRHELTDAEMQTMATLNDPWRMEQYAQMASSTRQQAMQEVYALQERLSQYESQQVARQRMASGADRVGSGQATGVASGRSAQPRNFDEFWEQWVGQG